MMPGAEIIERKGVRLARLRDASSKKNPFDSNLHAGAGTGSVGGLGDIEGHVAVRSETETR
jgi:hypothetical protein